MKKVLLVFVFVVLALLASCAKRDGEPEKFTTGRAVEQAEITSKLTIADRVQIFSRPVMYGKSAYAELTEEWILWCYEDFRKEINDDPLFGITGWGPEATCTFFTTRFTTTVQKHYMRRASQHDISKIAKGSGVGEFWYKPGGNVYDGKPWHSIVICVTDKGVKFFEPQTGKFVTLTDDEIDSAKFRNRKFD